MQPQQPPIAPINPGKTIAIIGFVLTFVGLGFVGIILAIIGLVKSKKAGFKNGFAVATIIINSVFAVVLIGGIILTIGLISYANVQLAAQCEKLGPGTHVNGSSTLVCDENSKPISGDISGSGRIGN